MLHQEQQTDTPLRYDAEMQRRIVEVAARLQQEDHEKSSAHQITTAAAEIGLEPHYVQQAIAQIQNGQKKTEQKTPVLLQTPHLRSKPPPSEHQRFLIAMSAPMWLGALAFGLKDFTTPSVL